MQNQVIKPASIGSISHGTMKESDLIEAFTEELEYQIQRNADYFQSSDDARKERANLLSLIWSAREYNEESALEAEDYEVGTEIIQGLTDYLNDFAGPYKYFGSHAGDGSDYGFWVDWDYINDCVHYGEVLLLNDDNIPYYYTGDAICINDHGNATGYQVKDGVVIRCYFDAV